MDKEMEKLNFIDQKEIENWFFKNQEIFGTTIYSSIDIRDSGQKIVPVDTNLFPAGFNNLREEEIKEASLAAKDFFKKIFGKIKSIGIIVEDHTRNINYFRNLYSLKKIFELTEIDFRFISLTHKERIIFEEPGLKLTIFPAEIISDYLISEGHNFDVLVSNNDFSEGIPDKLDKVKQPIVPKLCSGWFNRKKSDHLSLYAKTLQEFCDFFSLNPFFFSAQYKNCGEINFKEKLGLDCVANSVDKMIFKLRKEYIEYGISQDPYVFVKAERGTYGMGITTVNSGKEIYDMNKKIRNKMDVIKGGNKNTEVVIQEGISSIIKYDNNPAEVMIYTMNSCVVSRIIRFNSQKDHLSSLNSKGLDFVNLEDANGNLSNALPTKVYDIIARLAVLSAARELVSLY